MTKTRVLAALIMAPVAIAAILLLPTQWLAAAAAAVFLIGLWEWLKLAGIEDTLARTVLLVLNLLLMVLMVWADGSSLVLFQIATLVGVAWWLAALLWLLLERTTLGRSILLLGSNLQATRFSGVNTTRVLITVYVLSALMSWGAALLMMSMFNSAKAGYGESWLLVTILASVLGGINPDGGFGRVIGLVLALIVLQMLESGLNLLGVSSYLTMALWGGVLILFIALQNRKN